MIPGAVDTIARYFVFGDLLTHTFNAAATTTTIYAIKVNLVRQNHGLIHVSSNQSMTKMVAATVMPDDSPSSTESSRQRKTTILTFHENSAQKSST